MRSALKKPKMITIDVRPYPVRLYFTNCPKAYMRERIQWGGTEAVIDDACGISSAYDGGRIHVVGVFDGRVSTLAHELGHVCIKVLDLVRIPLTVEVSEPFCYLLGDLMEQCLPVLTNQKSRSKA